MLENCNLMILKVKYKINNNTKYNCIKFEIAQKGKHFFTHFIVHM